MSNGSPTAYLLWAILSVIFFCFLLGHLWAYDRFNCLKWYAGRQPGAFKRVMTYSYVATLPLLVLFSVAMTALKFKEGFVKVFTGEIIPRPLILWEPNNQHWLLPLYFILSIAWSLELVTHLEELTFWLFLLHQGPGKDDWFHSWEFRTWFLGSAVAVLGMPLTVLASRKDLELTQAWIFLAGSLASTSTTVCFLYVLARFPSFLLYVKRGGAAPDVVVRLTTFYDLNKARVVFRFLYSIPLLIIALDAVQGTHPVVRSSFALDFLLMMGGIGCFISSAITLLIFFPRPNTCSYEYDHKNMSLHDSAGAPSTYDNYNHSHSLSVSKNPYLHEDAAGEHLRSFRFPVNHPIPDPVLLYPTESQEGNRRHSAESQISPGYESDAESVAMPSPTILLTRKRSTGTSRPVADGRSDDRKWKGREEPSILPRRWQSPDGPSRPRKVGIAILGGGDSISEEEGRGRSSDLEREPATSPQLHPYVINFTSPIDLSDEPPQDPRLHAV